MQWVLQVDPCRQSFKQLHISPSFQYFHVVSPSSSSTQLVLQVAPFSQSFQSVHVVGPSSRSLQSVLHVAPCSWSFKQLFEASPTSSSVQSVQQVPQFGYFITYKFHLPLISFQTSLTLQSRRRRQFGKLLLYINYQVYINLDCYQVYQMILTLSVTCINLSRTPNTCQMPSSNVKSIYFTPQLVWRVGYKSTCNVMK